MMGHPDEGASLPGALAALPEDRRVEVDVRDDIRRGVEPFGRIMAAVRGLDESRVLVLRAPFEPAPLYDVLARRGFAHWTVRHAPDDWSIWFYREPATGTGATGAAASTVLDVRGLEPPEPMVRVLARLDALAPGGEFTVLHERRPLFLYPQIEDRGCVHETDEPEPGLVRIRVRRPAAEGAGS